MRVSRTATSLRNHRGRGFGLAPFLEVHMLYNNLGVKTLGEDEIVLSGSITQNNIPVLEQNYVEKMNANNGFSKERLFRKIASVPIAAHLQAAQEGYDLDNARDLRRFLEANPDYLSVDRIDSHRSANIIIK